MRAPRRDSRAKDEVDLSPECSEPRLLPMKLRVADDGTGTSSGGSAGECTDRTRVWQQWASHKNLKEEENVIVTRGADQSRRKQGKRCVRGSSRGAPWVSVWHGTCHSPKRVKCALPEPGTRGTWSILGKLRSISNSSATCSREQHKARSFLVSALRFCRPERKFYRERTFCLLEACQNRLARRLLAMTKRNWDSETTHRHISNTELHRKLGIVSLEMELRIRRLAGPKERQCKLKRTSCPINKSWRQSDRYPCMTSDGKLTIFATPWAKHF